MLRSAKDLRNSVRHTFKKADARYEWTNTRETSITLDAKLSSLTYAKVWTHAPTCQKHAKFPQVTPMKCWCSTGQQQVHLTSVAQMKGRTLSIVLRNAKLPFLTEMTKQTPVPIGQSFAKLLSVSKNKKPAHGPIVQRNANISLVKEKNCPILQRKLCS